MSLTPLEAEVSLAVIETIRRESGARLGYRRAAPHLMGWGVAWAVGYTGSATLSPVVANDVWLGLIVAMTVFSAWMMRRQSAGRLSWTRIGCYTAVPNAGLILAVNLVSAAFNLRSTIDILALYCLAVALCYVAVSRGPRSRFAALGIGLALMTVLGLLVVPGPWRIGVFFLDAVMLVAAGLWLRRA